MFSSTRHKLKQDLITLLEPRRLMSISGGTEYLPSDAAPTQYTHSFGFEPTIAAADVQMPSPENFNPLPGGLMREFGTNDFNSGDVNFIESQFAAVVARGAPADSSEPPVDNEVGFGGSPDVDHSAHVNTLTAMYSELNTSTANSIDDGTAATSSTTLATLIAAENSTFQPGVNQRIVNAFSATGSNNVAVLQQAVSISAITSTNASNATERATTLDTSITPVITLPSSLVEVQAAPTSSDVDVATLPHRTLQNVEQELLTVSNFANEMITQLGRDIAIELSHLQSDLGLDGMSEQLTTHWDGWRSAATVTGAAIATVIYVQSEADREKPKAASTFSTSVIQAIPN